MLQNSYIIAILQENRTETATQVQDILTKYGCYIRVRLGLHDAGLEHCSSEGLVLLQFSADEAHFQEFITELNAVPLVKINSMSLNFEA